MDIMGIIVYSNQATLQFNFNKQEYYTLAALQAAIRAIPHTRGGTRTDKALEMANDQLFTPGAGDRAHANNVLIVLTDGKTNSGSKPYSQVLKPLQVCNHPSFPKDFTNDTAQANIFCVGTVCVRIWVKKNT